MPKGKFIHTCDQCGHWIYQGIEKDSRVFCNEECARAHSSIGRTEVSRTSDQGSNPCVSATIPDEVFEHMAIDYLVDDLKQDMDDPDFPRWKTRCTDLFRRYKPLAETCTRPLGEGWPDDHSEVVDEVLDILERKIEAAEEMLLDKQDTSDDTPSS